MIFRDMIANISEKKLAVRDGWVEADKCIYIEKGLFNGKPQKLMTLYSKKKTKPYIPTGADIDALDWVVITRGD